MAHAYQVPLWGLNPPALSSQLPFLFLRHIQVFPVQKDDISRTLYPLLTPLWFWLTLSGFLHD